jgi:hypothetical protein
MNLDTRISTAINAAVRKEGQPNEVASLLTAWIGRVIDGSESADTRDALLRHVEALYDAVECKIEEYEE